MYEMKLTNNQLQVIISGVLGDGYIGSPQNINGGSSFKTTCIHKDYLEYKAELLKPLQNNIKSCEKNGYAQKPIYTLKTHETQDIRTIREWPLEQIVNSIDELGIALWVYDDGSLHKTKMFYNICTHSFTEEENKKYLIPLLNKYDIYPTVAKEIKRDGRVFYYLRVNKYKGAYQLSKLLKKYPVSSMSYKIWTDYETDKWEKAENRQQKTGTGRWVIK